MVSDAGSAANGNERLGGTVSGTLSRREFARWAAGSTAVGLIPVLGTRSIPLAGAAPASTFYVSAAGNDNADGRSPATAWATIQKANSSLPNDGSALLFRRGDTFYGELAPPFGCEVGAYGAGARPVLTMFKLLNRADGWTEHATGVWSIDLGSPGTHDGYTASNDANIGYLMVDGQVKPVLKFALSGLSDRWDFSCDIDKNMLYVKSPANPTTLAADIKAAPNGNAYGMTGRVVYCEKGSNNIHDLHVTGTGGCGIGGTGADVHIHDCLIDYIGGSELRDGTRTRYGNGIENWVNVRRWIIENNEIAQVYDVAWSPQGNAEDSGGWEDMTVRKNYIHNCTQSFEFWSKGSMSAPGFQRILVQGNHCERAGYSAFSDVRPNQNVRVHLLSYLLQTPIDITIEDNVFDDAYGSYSFHHQTPPDSFITRNNAIRLRPDRRLQYQMPQTIERFADWQRATGRENGSTFEAIVT